MWSGPRNLSTAMMGSFATRACPEGITRETVLEICDSLRFAVADTHGQSGCCRGLETAISTVAMPDSQTQPV